MKPSDRYETPPEVFAYWHRIFRFELDVCAEAKTAKCRGYWTEKDDALQLGWGQFRCWCNPPYSNPSPWVDKALLESSKSALVVMLLPADASTQWYQRMKDVPSRVTLLHPPGRIRFLLDGVRQGSPKFGNVVAIFWPQVAK
jgi:phage N-6-adenine-methyltransferase